MKMAGFMMKPVIQFFNKRLKLFFYLILVQMESFHNLLIDLKMDGQEITPNLNQLIKNNTYFPHFYSNAGQGTTSDAEIVVNTSFYVPKNEPATSSKYMDKQLPSLPHLLKENGYFTATFHTKCFPSFVPQK